MQFRPVSRSPVRLEDANSAADGGADDAPRPSGADQRGTGKTASNGDAGQIGHPKPIWAMDLDLLGNERKDRAAVIAAGLGAKRRRSRGFGALSFIARRTSFESTTIPRWRSSAPTRRQPNVRDDRHVAGLGSGIGMETGPCGPHQLASPPDREPAQIRVSTRVRRADPPSEPRFRAPGVRPAAQVPRSGLRTRPSTRAPLSPFSIQMRIQIARHVVAATELMERLAVIILGNDLPLEFGAVTAVSSGHGLSSSKSSRRVDSTDPTCPPARAQSRCNDRGAGDGLRFGPAVRRSTVAYPDRRRPLRERASRNTCEDDLHGLPRHRRTAPVGQNPGRVAWHSGR